MKVQICCCCPAKRDRSKSSLSTFAAAAAAAAAKSRLLLQSQTVSRSSSVTGSLLFVSLPFLPVTRGAGPLTLHTWLLSDQSGCIFSIAPPPPPFQWRWPPLQFVRTISPLSNICPQSHTLSHSLPKCCQHGPHGSPEAALIICTAPLDQLE